MQMENAGACRTCELSKGCGVYGPRLIVRSIKGIQRGEEVTVTYTDLLQPTILRRSELLPKYQFACDCRRCSAVPQTYVDLALREMFCVEHNYSSRIFNNCYKEQAVEKLRDMLDSTIAEYMEVGDAVSSCEKIESLLSEGMFNQHLEQTRDPNICFRLSPLHHLSLNAYTTLVSTYKICASLKVDDEHFHSFDMSRTSAAYSFLLAGATHHLFLFESSLIASAATFWTDAGQSLLSLARSLSWNSLADGMPRYLSPLADLKCSRCVLAEKFESNFSSAEIQNRFFDDMSREFHICISFITPKVWSFLIQGCKYLKDVKDPIDFSWVGAMRMSNMWDPDGQLHHGGGDGDLVTHVSGSTSSEVRTNISRLGVHCLLYGGYLSSICYGHQPYRTHFIWNILRS